MPWHYECRRCGARVPSAISKCSCQESVQPDTNLLEYCARCGVPYRARLNNGLCAYCLPTLDSGASAHDYLTDPTYPGVDDEYTFGQPLALYIGDALQRSRLHNMRSDVRDGVLVP